MMDTRTQQTFILKVGKVFYCSSKQFRLLNYTKINLHLRYSVIPVLYDVNTCVPIKLTGIFVFGIRLLSLPFFLMSLVLGCAV